MLPGAERASRIETDVPRPFARPPTDSIARGCKGPFVVRQHRRFHATASGTGMVIRFDWDAGQRFRRNPPILVKRRNGLARRWSCDAVGE
jgi:hypothetical protein